MNKPAEPLTPATVSASALAALIDEQAPALEAAVIAWRRDLHQHPELGNREFRTAGIVADHLRALGFDEVRTGVAQNGEEVGVMHACGHDCHVAILMGVASLLAGLREHIAGSVKFIFQPAEEMPPPGEEGGAKMMVAEGALENPRPGAIFGLHVTSRQQAGRIGWRSGPTMASSDYFRIEVQGRQTHGAAPWLGVDPIVTSAQIVLGLQTIVSRTQEITREPAVVTVGIIKGGVRENIIPDQVEMRGTIRTFDEGMRDDIHERVTTLAEAIARGNKAGCQVCVQKNYPVTVNDPALTAAMLPTLQRVGGAQLEHIDKVTGSEDFSFFQREVPGLFVFLGVTAPEIDARTAPPNHSPLFRVDERALLPGVRLLAHLSCDWLGGAAQAEGTAR
jgi:amidohydrolase